MRLKSLHFYIVIVYALLNFNKSVNAQCATGSPKTVTYTKTGSPISLFDTYNMPKFNPSLGTLIGINYNLSTSGFTMLNLINGDSFDNSFSMMQFNRKDMVTLPGVGMITISDTTIFYPDVTLGASDNPTPMPPYSVNGDGSNEWWGDAFAPDAKTYSTAIPAAAFATYTGTGTVSVNYDIIPFFFARGIGSHYTLNYVTMATNINMSITYTYCTNSVLSSGRLEFFAKASENDNIALSWTKENEENNILYGIEMSTTGVDFTAIGSMQSKKPENPATVVKYMFDYDRPAGVTGKLYFRVKQTDAAGKIRYTAIKWVDANHGLQTDISLFPNPATNEVTLQFRTAQQNTMQVQLVNSIGQVVQTSRLNLNGTSQGTMQFNSKYASGVYFLKVINEKTKDQQVSRLIIK
ncbi:MAG: T9SS type A sorting domain-containing protein [Chitinophagaceae bacterium]|nr:T9SS type A sorting domain-containing protein [Chitinophagaceae bacterium]